MAPKPTFKTQLQWKSLLKFFLFQPSDSAPSATNSLPQSRQIQLVEAQLDNKRILRLDFRHWQDDKALNGISMTPAEASFLAEKLAEVELQASHCELENDKSLAILVEPQPMLLQVSAKKVNAMLLDASAVTRLRSLLPSLLWAMDLKMGSPAEMKQDILIALIALKCKEKAMLMLDKPLDDLSDHSSKAEFQAFIRTKQLKMAATRAFARLGELFGLTQAEMMLVVSDFFEAIDSFEDEIMTYIADAMSGEDRDTEGDLRKLERLYELMDDEEENIRKRKFSDGNRKRQKLAGGPPSKRTRPPDAVSK